MEGAYVTGPAKNLIHIGAYGKQVASGTGIDLVVATYGRGGWVPEPFLKALDKAGLPSEILNERKRFDRTIVDQLHALVEKHQPDVIQSHMVKSHFLMRYSGLAKTRTWLAFHHGYTKVDRKMMLYNQIDRWSLRAARQIVTVCQPFVQELLERGVPRERITVQHNSVPPFRTPPPEMMAERRARLGIPQDMPVLLALGRLSFEKGYADLVEAAALVRRVHPEFRLVIVGEGHERQQIEAVIRRTGMADHVILAGHDNHVDPWLAMASGLVISSHSEGSPNALLEAMAAGLPIVATKVGGIPEIVTTERDALLVPPHSIQTMADAMARILNNPALATALGDSARRTADTRHSIPAHYHSLINVYERLTGIAAPAN